MGLTNWIRAQQLVTLAATPLWVQLLTALPTTDGTSGGGLLDEVEWSLSRKQVNDIGGASPAWVAAAGPNGGQSLENLHLIEWDATDTAALAADASIVGVGIYSASTGGSTVGYVALATTRVVPIGGIWRWQIGDLVINVHKELC